MPKKTLPAQTTLNAQRLALVPITAFTAAGDLGRLDDALVAGLDAGLTISGIKEALVQTYAYCGFPRCLNALGVFMKLLDARRERGIDDAPGEQPSPLPPPDPLLELGTANQTKLSGKPVNGPLFEFAPQVDQYLKAHLFGAIFARDNLGWPERELATLGALSMLPGAEAQLRSHMGIARNVGLTDAQLQGVVDALRRHVSGDAADRADAARQAAAAPKDRRAAKPGG